MAENEPDEMQQMMGTMMAVMMLSFIPQLLQPVNGNGDGNDNGDVEPPPVTPDPEVTEISNLTVDYGGDIPITMWGDAISATLSFTHKGQGGYVWVGLGVALVRANCLFHAMELVYLQEDLMENTYIVDVQGIVPQDLSPNALLDVERFIEDEMPILGSYPPDAYGVNDWDVDVYRVPDLAEFRLLGVGDETVYGDYTGDKYNGDPVHASIKYEHRGLGGQVEVGLVLDYPPYGIFWDVDTVNNDQEWTEYISDVYGYWYTTLEDGKWVHVLKFLQVIGGQHDPGGNFYIDADWDSGPSFQGVWRHRTGTPSQGTSLKAGYNNVAYQGTVATPSVVFSSIMQYLNTVWLYRNGEWLFYDPSETTISDLKIIYTGEALWIQVLQDCYWTY